MSDFGSYYRSLGQIIEDRAERCGDKAFLQFEEGKEFTYREVNGTVNRIANGLRKLGVEKGDKIALFLSNSLECVYLWFGASKAGVVDVPINLANKGDFLSHHKQLRFEGSYHRPSVARQAQVHRE